MISQLALGDHAGHGPKCGILWLSQCAWWLDQWIQHWHYGHSFGYWRSLVTGYKHTLTKARVRGIQLQAGKVVGEE